MLHDPTSLASLFIRLESRIGLTSRCQASSAASRQSGTENGMGMGLIQLKYIRIKCHTTVPNAAKLRCIKSHVVTLSNRWNGSKAGRSN